MAVNSSLFLYRSSVQDSIYAIGKAHKMMHKFPQLAFETELEAVNLPGTNQLKTIKLNICGTAVNVTNNSETLACQLQRTPRSYSSFYLTHLFLKKKKKASSIPLPWDTS